MLQNLHKLILVNLCQPIFIAEQGHSVHTQAFRAEREELGRGDRTYTVREVYVPVPVTRSLADGWINFYAVVTVNEAIIAATQKISPKA